VFGKQRFRATHEIGKARKMLIPAPTLDGQPALDSYPFPMTPGLALLRVHLSSSLSPRVPYRGAGTGVHSLGSIVGGVHPAIVPSAPTLKIM